MQLVACPADLEPHMPLKLKGILIDFELGLREFAAAIIQTGGYVKGKRMSLTGAADIIQRNRWPSLTPKQEIVRQAEEFLRVNGVPEDVIATAFELDDNPNGYPAGQPSSAHQSGNDDAIIDTVETEMLTAQAKKHFNLFRDPFTDDVQAPEDVFLSADQRYIREHMLAVAKHGGLLAVIGESGSGKTTLFNDLVDRINSHNEPIIVCAPSVVDVDLSNLKTRLSARRIMESIIAQLTGERPGASMEKLTRQVKNALLATTAPSGERHASVVVVIEEAHSLLPATLKTLKRLIEMRDGHRNLLGVILIAQPEMHELLNEVRHPELREFIARCTIATLMPLDNALEDYLRVKFKRIGVDYTAVFSADAAVAIQQQLTVKDRSNKSVSLVYPLLVNRTVIRAMNRAAQAGEPRITAELMKGV